jgi:long-subunit acyl-CoA synthetase (AMP-forming)
VTHLNPGHPDRIKVDTLGLLLPNTVGKVVDPESGADLGPEVPGEVWVRGPQITEPARRDGGDDHS